MKELSSPAGPRHVTQTRRDHEEYVRYLLEDKLGVTVVPILVSSQISEKARRRASSYGIRHYKPSEIENLLR